MKKKAKRKQNPTLPKMRQKADAARSAIMRAVKSRDTIPEKILRELLSSAGFHYRVHNAALPGKPDIVFPRRRKAIFVHGCFWHGHSCKRGARIPKTNTAYWTAKIARNKKRDARARKELRAAGWKPLTIWECQMKSARALSDRLERFLAY